MAWRPSPYARGLLWLWAAKLRLRHSPVVYREEGKVQQSKQRHPAHVQGGKHTTHAVSECLDHAQAVELRGKEGLGTKDACVTR